MSQSKQQQKFLVQIDQQQYNNLTTSLSTINNNVQSANNLISNNFTRDLNTHCTKINTSVQNLHNFQQQQTNIKKLNQEQLKQRIHDLFTNGTNVITRVFKSISLQNYNYRNLINNYSNHLIHQI